TRRGRRGGPARSRPGGVLGTRGGIVIGLFTGSGLLACLLSGAGDRMLRCGTEEEEGEDEHAERGDRHGHEHGQTHPPWFDGLLLTGGGGGGDVSRQPAGAFGAGVYQDREAHT